MHRRLAVLVKAAPAAVLVAAALTLGIPALDSDAAKRRCAMDRGRIIVATPTGRITSVREDGRRTWYACLNRLGRRQFLAADRGRTVLVRPRLAGRYAAFEEKFVGEGVSGSDVVVTDLTQGGQIANGLPDITDMVLSPRGHVIATTRDEVLLVQWRGAVTTIDSGEIRSGSLALNRDSTIVYWQNGGEVRSSTLPR